MRRHLTFPMLCLLCCLSAVSFGSAPAQAQTVTTDSRIKTLVFSPNEVFTLTTHYGYQSNIEFGVKETIETISLGDRVAWQITPAGRRLFIRAQEENAHTNMTVVTNLRAYQFDLRSSAANAVFGSEELTYVVRFFYPEEAADGSIRPVTYATPQNVVAAPAYTGSVPAAPALNYRYTYSGAGEVAPVKVFDDGKSTFFKFKDNGAPQISVLTAKGESLEIPTRRTPEGLVSVSVIAPRFSVTKAGHQVTVYNESAGGM